MDYPTLLITATALYHEGFVEGDQMATYTMWPPSRPPKFRHRASVAERREAIEVHSVAENVFKRALKHQIFVIIRDALDSLTTSRCTSFGAIRLVRESVESQAASLGAQYVPFKFV